MRLSIRATVILLAANSLFAQGLYWESTNSGMMGATTEKHFYAPKMFKTETVGREMMIVRIDTKMMTTINPADKTYSQISFSEMQERMKKGSEKMSAAMEQMKKQLAAMPPQQRKMMEQMMKDKMPAAGGMGMSGLSTGPVEVKKTGEQQTISGYNCTKYVVMRGADVATTMWTTMDVKDFSVMRADMEEFSKTMAGMLPQSADLAQSYAKIEGFPIQTEMGKDFKSTVTKIEKRAIPASEFEIPAGYSKRIEDDEDGVREYWSK